jgi:hypothetical protein
MICLFCDGPAEVRSWVFVPTGATCTDCDVYAYLQNNGRWKVYLPSSLVPTSDWVDCPACEGMGFVYCESPWCTDMDHNGPCHQCRTLGVVRVTLDHPTTHPPQETP